MTSLGIDWRWRNVKVSYTDSRLPDDGANGQVLTLQGGKFVPLDIDVMNMLQMVPDVTHLEDQRLVMLYEPVTKQFLLRPITQSLSKDMLLNPFDIDLETFFDAVNGGSQSLNMWEFQKVAYMNFMKSLKDFGLWTKLKKCYLFPSLNPFIDFKNPDDSALVPEGHCTWFNDGFSMNHWYWNDQYMILPFNASTDIDPSVGVTVFDNPCVDMVSNEFQWGSFSSASSAFCIRYYRGGNAQAHDLQAFDGSAANLPAQGATVAGGDSLRMDGTRRSEAYSEYCFDVQPSATTKSAIRRNGIVMETKTSAITSTPPNWDIALGCLTMDSGLTTSFFGHYKTSHFMIFDGLSDVDRSKAHDFLGTLKQELRLPAKHKVNNNIVLQGNSHTENYNDMLYRVAMRCVEQNFDRISYCGKGGHSFTKMQNLINNNGLLVDPNSDYAVNAADTQSNTWLAESSEIKFLDTSARRNVIVNFEAINELTAHYSVDPSTCVEKTLDACETWVSSVRSIGYNMVIMSQMPIGNKDLRETDDWYLYLSEVNEGLKENAGKKYGDYVMDIGLDYYKPRDDFLSDSDYFAWCRGVVTDGLNYSGDNIHLSEMGYTKLGECIGRQLSYLIQK
eukprot:TRINITY_DN4325_c1_g2_i1.p1 TRINITY_DN4325_c1_g2~~TRINITY_DN4325_c1_g2_i1.p1  ORF type:complete len:617 (+),score=141.96 TRINITY_DN4325_c1_g2_i1:1091-2941(+)